MKFYTEYERAVRYIQAKTIITARCISLRRGDGSMGTSLTTEIYNLHFLQTFIPRWNEWIKLYFSLLLVFMHTDEVFFNVFFELLQYHPRIDRKPIRTQHLFGLRYLARSTVTSNDLIQVYLWSSKVKNTRTFPLDFTSDFCTCTVKHSI